MPDLDPASFDLPTLAALAGVAATEHVLERLRDAGYAGVRSSHGYIIQLLVAGEPTVGELADQLGVTQQAASKSVIELEGLGLVERRRDPTDSRVRRLSLTDRGHDLVDDSRRERRALEQRVRNLAGGRDVTAAKQALTALLVVTDRYGPASRRRARPPASG